MNLSADARARRARVRKAAAVVILIAWAGALGGLVKRDVLRTPAERLAEVAVRVNPGNIFYEAERDGRLIGWASSTIDTIADTLSIREELVADLATGAAPARRIAARTYIALSRGMQLRSFVVETDTGTAATRVSGRPDGDSGVVFVSEINGVRGDSQRVQVSGPVLLPTMLPLATVLRGTPRPGRTVTHATFDPAARTASDVTVRILAESLFVVSDSARLDEGTGRWVPAVEDTVRAWKLVAGEGSVYDGWVDAQGRAVAQRPFGLFNTRRIAFEMSFENWRLDARMASQTAPEELDRILDALPLDALRASVRRPAMLTARLIAPSLAAFDLRGGRQDLDGNVVSVRAERAEAFEAEYTLPPAPTHRARFGPQLEAEPFLQTRAPAMLRQAVAIVRHERDPREVAQLLLRWVADSIAPAQPTGLPDALQVLSARRGDVREHVLLFTALARSLDIPTRIVTGVIVRDGRVHHHTWTEVFLRDWVAVDPSLGQFPASAAHIRLLVGGLGRRAELERLAPTLHIEVLESR